MTVRLWCSGADAQQRLVTGPGKFWFRCHKRGCQQRCQQRGQANSGSGATNGGASNGASNGARQNVAPSVVGLTTDRLGCSGADAQQRLVTGTGKFWSRGQAKCGPDRGSGDQTAWVCQQRGQANSGSGATNGGVSNGASNGARQILVPVPATGQVTGPGKMWRRLSSA
jgi:hypothetical protein